MQTVVPELGAKEPSAQGKQAVPLEAEVVLEEEGAWVLVPGGQPRRLTVHVHGEPPVNVLHRRAHARA